MNAPLSTLSRRAPRGFNLSLTGLLAGLLSCLLMATQLAYAAVEVHRFDDPAQEARYKVLINELRCLVCQNQNLADSNAELATDLRTRVSEMILAGDDDQAIIDVMLNRYGDFVLYKPPFKISTSLLWLGPFMILAGAVLIPLWHIRRRRQSATPDEQALRRARHLLDDQDGDDDHRGESS